MSNKNDLPLDRDEIIEDQKMQEEEQKSEKA
jgi:hypothetical protein